MKLIYFDIRGRADAIRLLLEDLAVPYEDRRLALHEWRKVKASVPFGQIPVLEDEELRVAQSQAILRHLARKYDRYGQDAAERARCDVAQELIVDANRTLGAFLGSPSFEEKREQFAAQDLLRMLAMLDEYLRQSVGAPEFWVGKAPTYIDAVAWSYLDIVRAFSVDTLNHFPTLAQFAATFRRRPRIAAYLASGRRPATIFMPWFSFGGTPETS